MPSDPSGVSPKGVLTRTPPDFFDDHLATGGANYITDPPVGNTYASISLFNNASSGILFKVYGITVGNDNLGTAFAYFLQGAPLGSFVQPCVNIRGDQGAPYGQIFKRIDTLGTPTALYPLPIPNGFSLLGAPDAGSHTIISPFPLFIIPVGYSLVIANEQSASSVWAAFWYQQANE